MRDPAPSQELTALFVGVALAGDEAVGPLQWPSPPTRAGDPDDEEGVTLAGIVLATYA